MNLETDDELYKEARKSHSPRVSDEAIRSAIKLLRETQYAIEFIKKNGGEGNDL